MKQRRQAGERQLRCLPGERAQMAREQRAATDKVREQAREVRFGTPEPEAKPLDKILGRFNRKGA